MSRLAWKDLGPLGEISVVSFEVGGEPTFYLLRVVLEGDDYVYDVKLVHGVAEGDVARIDLSTDATCLVHGLCHAMGAIGGARLLAMLLAERAVSAMALAVRAMEGETKTLRELLLDDPRRETGEDLVAFAQRIGFGPTPNLDIPAAAVMTPRASADVEDDDDRKVH